MQVGYLDFVQFDGNPGNFDYSLPRMSFIRNEDFKYLERVDRDSTSSTEYGVLPVFFCCLYIFAPFYLMYLFVP